MKITLSPNNETLNEVVVTGVSNMDRRMFTGATDKIKANDAIIGGMADISRSLEGRSAGVSVQNVSGTFGTAPKIHVRGATSIYGNSNHYGLLMVSFKRISPTLAPMLCHQVMQKH